MSRGEDQARRFLQLAAEEWDANLKADPFLATTAGDHRFDDRLPRWSEGDFAERLAHATDVRRRLGGIDRDALPERERLNLDLFTDLLDKEIAELGFHSYRMPISKTDGYHSFFPELVSFHPFETLVDYENYISRLAAFRESVDDLIDLMRTGLREGQVPPRVTLDGVEEQIQAQVVESPAASRLHEPLGRWPQAIAERDRSRLLAEGNAAILQSVVPGYRTLLRFVRQEYLPAARATIAAADLPDGRAFYNHRVSCFTSPDLSPEAVHQIGRDEVRRIRAEMDDVIGATGFSGSFAEFLQFLRTDPRFYVETPLALLQHVAYILKRIDGELPRLFKTLPRAPYGLRPMPDAIAPGNTSARCWPASGDGTHAGTYFLNTHDLKSRPLYEMEALSLHEAVPGHHLQLALQRELGELPPFRRYGDFTAYVEGWALYAERLGLEMGFFEDPYSNFGRLSFEMWRACRLVVDTGIHALGWTRQRAIDYMAGITALTPLNIANEVDRYIAWPGQALAYKVGEIKIRELRARAEKELGARFDVREFHDVVLLSGALPLAVLERLVVDWIGRVRGGDVAEADTRGGVV